VSFKKNKKIKHLERDWGWSSPKI